MRKNIFIKSVLRQPVRAFILTLLIGAAAFAFVARAAEYIIVSDEITRIEGYLRAVGTVSPVYFTNFTTAHDVTRARSVIENNRRVAVVDAREFVQGVIPDTFNTVTRFQSNYFTPVPHGINIAVTDQYFIGHIIRKHFTNEPGRALISLFLEVSELLVGDPRAIRSGTRVFVNEHGQEARLFSRYTMTLHLTDEEADMYSQGLWDPFDGLEIEESAMFRAMSWYEGIDDGWQTVFNWYLLPLAGAHGLQAGQTIVDRAGRPWHPIAPDTDMRSRPSELTFVVDAADDAAMGRILNDLQGELDILAQNVSGMMVISTKDMTAIPRLMNRRIARLLDTSLYPGGRWLNYEDYEQGNRVAVIPAQYAIRNGIRVGDTINITLYGGSRPGWIDQPTNSPWSRGVENWWDSHPQGWWVMAENGADRQNVPTYTLELEVVGIHWFTPMNMNNFTGTEMYVPEGIIPEGFGWADAPQLTGLYSFVLDSPRSQDAFIRETEAALYELGFVANFMPNGFGALATATDPIIMSITVNLLVFGAVSALLLALVVFVYIRQWRRSMAVSRALGIPGDTVLRKLFGPVICLWVPAAAAGSAIAWRFALGQAESALTALPEYVPETQPAGYWLVILAGAFILFMLAGLLAGGYNTLRRPVLEQLQGVSQKRRKVKYVDPGELPEGFAVGDFNMPEPLPAPSGGTWRAALRHSTRHIFRSPVKTALSATLAVLFVFSLGWLNHTIIFTEAEIEWLWENTRIEAEIFRQIDTETMDDENQVLAATALPPVHPSTWDFIESTGFVTEPYLIAHHSVRSSIANGANFVGVNDLAQLIEDNTKTTVDMQLGLLQDDITIEFAPGFGMEDFVHGEGPPPVIMCRNFFALFEEADPSFGYNPVMGGPLELYAYQELDVLHNEHMGVDMFAHLARRVEVRVIGVFDGGLSRGIYQFGNSELVIIPLESLRSFTANRWPYVGNGSWDTVYPIYYTARFVVNPALNREIARLRELVEAPLENHVIARSQLPLVLNIEDDVLANVIEPLEQNLSLLRVLYPIAIAGAFVLAFGLTILIMLQNAKNAAIMRVLGTSKAASQVVLCVEMLLVCVSGALLGLGVLLAAGAFDNIVPLALTGVYLAGAVLGAVVGAYVINARPPLNMLQVRE